MHASLNPTGYQPPAIEILHGEDLYIAKALNVLLLTNRGSYWEPYQQSVNIFKFLEASGHNVNLIDELYDYVYLSVALQDIDGIVIPSLIFGEGGKRSNLDYLVEVELRNFANTGGRVVFTGNNAVYYLENIFSAEITPGLSPSSTAPPYFLYPGTSFIAQNTYDTIFTSYYTPQRLLPTFFDAGIYIARNAGEENCAYGYGNDYSFYGESDYLYLYPKVCGVWSQHFGEGDITFIGSTFADT